MVVRGRRIAAILALVCGASLLALLPSVGLPSNDCVYSGRQCDMLDTWDCWIEFPWGGLYPGIQQRCYKEYYCPEYYLEYCEWCVCMPFDWW